MKILIINGPNLNMLGQRDPKHYGSLTLERIEQIIREEFSADNFVFRQSNLEGEIISWIQTAENEQFEGIVINPGGYAHTSVAIRDALEGCKLPKAEVHLSHIANRDDFRQVLISSQGADGYISGFKEHSYCAGVYLLKKIAGKR